MTIERVVTETEKRILANRAAKSATPSKVYAACTIESLSNVYKECGGRAALLYTALIGNCNMVVGDEFFKLSRVYREALRLDGPARALAAKRLETAGYIEVTRKAGHKNLFRLTTKGKKGRVSTKTRYAANP